VEPEPTPRDSGRAGFFEKARTSFWKEALRSHAPALQKATSRAKLSALQPHLKIKTTRHTLSHPCVTFQGWRRWSRGLYLATRRQTARGVRYLPTSGPIRCPEAPSFVAERIFRGKISIVDANWGLHLLRIAHLQPALIQHESLEHFPGVRKLPPRPPAMELSMLSCLKGNI
jgi:hypothetical protein